MCQQYMFTLTGPPLKSLAALVFSWQLRMGRGFNIPIQITGRQYVFTLTEPPPL